MFPEQLSGDSASKASKRYLKWKISCAIFCILLILAIIAIIVLIVQLQNRISYINRSEEENKKNLESRENPHFFDKGFYYLQSCKLFECDPNCDNCVFDPAKESHVGTGGSIFLDRSNLTDVRLNLAYQSILRLEVESEIRAENTSASALTSASASASASASVAPVINVNSFVSLLISSGQLVMHSDSKVSLTKNWVHTGICWLERGAKILVTILAGEVRLEMGGGSNLATTYARTPNRPPEIYLKEMAKLEIDGSIRVSYRNICPTFLMIGSNAKLSINTNAEVSLGSDSGLIITDNTTLNFWGSSKNTYLGDRTRCVVDSPGKDTDIFGLNCTGVVGLNDQCKEVTINYEPNEDFRYGRNKTYEFPEGMQCFYLGSQSECEQWNAKVDAIRIDKGYKANCNITAAKDLKFCFST